MRVVIVGALGSAVALACARAARRYAVSDRLRGKRDRGPRRLPAWLHGRIARALDAAAIEVPPAQAVSTWGWSVIVAAVVGLGVGGGQFAVGMAVGVAVALPVVVFTLRDRRARRIAEAVPEMLEHVAAELRSGGTIATAIGSVGAGDGPLAPDLALVDTRIRLGASRSDALRAWARERAVPGIDASAGALATCASVGGASADALDGLATSLRDRLAVAAEARALSAQARMSAVVVGGAPVAYIAWAALVDPHSLDVLLGTSIGRACLACGIALEALGAWWMRGIVRNGSS